MRVVMVAPSISAPYGTERVVVEEIRWLLKQGHSVGLIVEKGPSPFEIPLVAVPGLFAFHWMTPNAALAEAQGTIDSFLRTFAPDLIHFVEVPEARLVRFLADRFPHVATAHTVSPTCPASHRLVRGGGTCEKRSGWSCLLHNRFYGCLTWMKSDLHRAHAIRNFLLKRDAFRAGHWIAISRYLAGRLVEDGWSRAQVHLLPNPVSDLAAVPPADPPRPLIFAACRLVPLKGLDLVLSAVSELEGPWNLWIAGDGPEEANLKSQAQRLSLGERVRFLGRLSPEASRGFLQAADVVVQGNRGPEGFGLTVAEAAWEGKAVVASRVPALDEILRHGETGWLVSPNSPEAFRSALREALGDESMRRARGAAAQHFARAEFSAQTHGERLLSIYQKVIAA